MNFQTNDISQISTGHLLSITSPNLTLSSCNNPHQLAAQNSLDFPDYTLNLDLPEGIEAQENISINSKKIQKNVNRREKYKIISNDIRLELIDCVINKGEKIKRAASRLGINYSSAKSIF